VITDDGGPIGRGFLTVSPAAGRGGRDAMRTGTIDEDGTFKVEGVAPGTNRFSLRFMTSETFESTTLEFDIPDRQVFHLDIMLPAGRIAGFVLDEATRLPLADVRVSLSAEGEDTGGGRGQRGRGGFGGRGRSVVTDASGAFQFRLLTAGTYDLEARPPGDLATGDGEPYFNAEVSGLVLAEGRVMEGIELVVGPGGSIAVSVVDENNEPVEGAQVTATPDGRNGSAIRRGRTGDDGLAVVDGVKPGIYALNIQARWMAQETVEGIAVASGRTVNETVNLQAGLQVSVRLTDSDGQPVSGAEITLRNSRGSRLTVRGARGGRGNSYSLGNLAPGRYTIEAEWDDNQGSAEMDIGAAGTIPVQLK
jgi:protocatechuate 3,4-dioxygenase beta subunit